MAAEAAPAPTYSIAAIEYAPGPMTRVGSVKAGLICLPKGKLRWRDVARPSDDVSMQLLTSVLAANKMAVSRPPDPLFGDAPPMTTYRLKVTVTDMNMKLCVAGLGIGEKAPSGEGTLSVRWDTFDRAARTKVDSVTFDLPMPVNGRDPRTSTAVFGEALTVSAARYAARRRIAPLP